MKKVSQAVMALALTTGIVGVAGVIVTAPAAAQKKKDDKKAPAFKFSPDVQKAGAVAQPALAAGNIAAAEPAIQQMEAAVKNDDDRYIAAALRFELEQRKLQAAQQANPSAPLNEGALVPSLDALLASPKLPAENRGRMLYRRGAIAYNAKQFPQAIQYWQQAQAAGYSDPDLAVNMVRAREQSGDVAGALGGMEAEIARLTAAGQKPSEDLYKYALSRAVKANQPGQAVGWMQKYLAAYPSQKNWRDMLVTYGLAQNAVAKLDTPATIDLFRLMDASGSLADQYDYVEYSRKTLDRGLPVESQRVFKKGVAAGKLPSTNSEVRAMQTEIAKAVAAEGSLGGLETKARAAGDGKLAAQTADAYLSQENWAKAADLYRVALQKGGANTDEVNTRLGIALARSGDKAGAKAAFGAVRAQPRAGLATLWSTWVDTQA